MVNEFRNFMQRIEYDDSIEERRKRRLLDYLKGNLFSNVRVFAFEEYLIIENILKDFEYDVYLFKKLLETTYKVRNVIGSKNNDNKVVPRSEYLYAVHTIFKELNMDLYGYDNNYALANIALARTAFKMVYDQGVLNNEISIIDLTKEIYNRYCSGYNVNRSVCTIFKYLHRIEKGFNELEEKYKNVLTSEEFYSMFEYFRELDDLHFSDIIKEYYPIFENELFVLIKNAVSNVTDEKITTDYVMKYLANIVTRREQFNAKKESVIREVEKIDVVTESNVVLSFSKLIETINNNNNIQVGVSKDIISNIKNIYESRANVQREFLSNEFDNFFANCTSYINDLVIPSTSSKSGIDELIGLMVKNCKDFFIEYDSKKFKEIVDYILENTEISVQDLKVVGEKCAEFFKEADINKLKIINNSLKEFKEYVSKNFKETDFIDNIFETILVNNPDLLLKDNKLPELLKFLKGDCSLKEYGYKYPDFRINKNFLTYKFFDKIKENNYKFLMESSLPRLMHNLNYLDEKCGMCDINFANFNFDEDMIYTLLSQDLYSTGSNVLMKIKDLFDEKDFKRIMELNSELFMITSSDLEVIIKRCLLNENSDYNFYDLLSCELYYYRSKDYRNLDEGQLMKRDFRYINLDINNSRLFDAEDIVTDGYILYENLESVMNKYNERQEKVRRLNTLLVELEKENNIDAFGLNRVVEEIFELYLEVYGNVPYATYKNRVIDVIASKKEKCEYELSDISEELDLKKETASVYEIEKRDSDYTIEQIKLLINSIDSEAVKKDLDRFLTNFKAERQVKSDKKKNSTIETIKEIELKVQLLDRQVENLNYLNSIMNRSELKDNIEESFISLKTFTINQLDSYVNEDNRNDEEKIMELLEGKNLILFSEGIDLSEIPNDRNFIEKVHKFLGDTDFSILSPSFMKNASGENVEKFIDQRDGILSRRESRTPVRVYFIPVKNKYFNCYYVIFVNYKDHGHYDGGCSNDDVYNRRMREVKAFERLLDELNYDELINFIEESKEKYDVVMKPIVDKIETNDKKRKGKK